MEITEVKIRKITDERGKLLAVASVLIDNSFVVKDIRLVKNNEKYIVAMPSKWSNGEFKDICNPINKETRKMFEKAIMNEYSKLS